MTIEYREAVVATPDEHDTNPSSHPSFDSVLSARLSRRSLLKGSMGLAAGTFFSSGLLACAGGGSDSASVGDNTAKELRLDFAPVAKSLADTVIVPAGYTARVLYRLGDPIAAGIGDYVNTESEPGDSYAQRGGDHHDGMHYFGLGSSGTYSAAASDRGLLVINHEAITPLFLHVNGPTIVNNVRTVNDEVVKELNVHGVSIVEVSKTGSNVTYNRASPYNRRITTGTDMVLSGPAGRTAAMINKYSTDGSRTRGTVNNCANGYTPWGTYLTCEENWAGYFRRTASTDNPKRSAKEITSFNRYGVAGAGRELWATAIASNPADTSFARWNTEKLGASDDGSDDFRNVARDLLDAVHRAIGPAG
jgi:secreted PhoX family phosphatase